MRRHLVGQVQRDLVGLLAILRRSRQPSMIGWPVAWKWAVACRLGDSSQQPTCPQLRHSRRCWGEPDLPAPRNPARWALTRIPAWWVHSSDILRLIISGWSVNQGVLDRLRLAVGWRAHQYHRSDASNPHCAIRCDRCRRSPERKPAGPLAGKRSSQITMATWSGLSKAATERSTFSGPQRAPRPSRKVQEFCDR